MPLEVLRHSEDLRRATATADVHKVAVPKCRIARFDDYPQIAALEARYGLRTRSFAEWTHLWVENPVYQGSPDWPIGWVFESDEGDIVGHIANIPLSYQFRHKVLIAATSGDLVVDERYRIYAFRLLGRFLSQKEVDLFVNTTANPTGSKALETFRASRVPMGAWNQAAFWVTGYRGFSRSVLTKKQVPFVKALSLPVSLGLRIKGRLKCAPLPARNTGFEVRPCDHFDERFDDFWQTLIQSQPRTLLATRSRRALEWHFKYALNQSRAWVVTAESGGRMLAYAIFFQYDISTYRLRRWRLVDFQALEGRHEALIPILDWALKRCQAEGIHMLEGVGFAHEKQTIIDRFAPHRRELPSWCYFYKANNASLAASLKDPGVWDPSCFDGDATL